MFGIFDVEEAVRGVRVNDEIVDDSVERERGVEGSDVFIGDAVVSAAEEAEDWGGKIGCVLQRASGTVGIGAERAVIADYAGEAKACGGSEERLAAAETKSEGE